MVKGEKSAISFQKEPVGSAGFDLGRAKKSAVPSQKRQRPLSVTTKSKEVPGENHYGRVKRPM
jgi:hypothetical protein